MTKAKPKRRASAAKALIGLYCTSNQLAHKFLHKSVQKNHVNVAGTLINLFTIYCEQKQVSKDLHH